MNQTSPKMLLSDRPCLVEGRRLGQARFPRISVMAWSETNPIPLFLPLVPDNSLQNYTWSGNGVPSQRVVPWDIPAWRHGLRRKYDPSQQTATIRRYTKLEYHGQWAVRCGYCRWRNSRLTLVPGSFPRFKSNHRLTPSSFLLPLSSLFWSIGVFIDIQTFSVPVLQARTTWRSHSAGWARSGYYMDRRKEKDQKKVSLFP